MKSRKRSGYAAEVKSSCALLASIVSSGRVSRRLRAMKYYTKRKELFQLTKVGLRKVNSAKWRALHCTLENILFISFSSRRRGELVVNLKKNEL